ncbi:MAG: hypothetical protein KGJ02_00745 [Verrucomicrobiota bacterium]|nr:hypothetical protein [Verrucomicrobiota bacterium]
MGFHSLLLLVEDTSNVTKVQRLMGQIQITDNGLDKTQEQATKWTEELSGQAESWKEEVDALKKQLEPLRALQIRYEQEKKGWSEEQQKFTVDNERLLQEREQLQKQLSTFDPVLQALHKDLQTHVQTVQALGNQVDRFSKEEQAKVAQVQKALADISAGKPSFEQMKAWTTAFETFTEYLTAAEGIFKKGGFLKETEKQFQALKKKYQTEIASLKQEKELLEADIFVLTKLHEEKSK